MEGKHEPSLEKVSMGTLYVCVGNLSKVNPLTSSSPIPSPSVRLFGISKAAVQYLTEESSSRQTSFWRPGAETALLSMVMLPFGKVVLLQGDWR